ncbi:MAG: twin-arginine translocation signal domain-containing protein, partial [Hylemonella sp.]
MSTTLPNPELSRRGFLAGTAGAAGGLMVSFHVPLAQAQTSAVRADAPEINAWVVVKPDDT